MKQNPLPTIAATLFIALSAASAQTGPGRPAATPMPGIAKIVDDKVTIQFPNNPVSDILDIYERLIGKPLVRDSQIFRGPNLSLMPPEAVSKEEAKRLIESALLINGYLLIPGPEGNLKVVLCDPKIRQNPLKEGVTVCTAPEQLPGGDAVAAYFMPLDFLTPDDADALFETHFQLNQYGKITPIYAPPALLITENASLIKQMIALKPLVDVDASLTQPPVKTEMVEIKYADAVQVANIIQALVDNRKPNSAAPPSVSSKPAAGQNRPAGGQNKAAANPAGNPASAAQSKRPGQQPRQILAQNQLLSINAQLLPDPRTNKILLVTEPQNFAYLRGLISELDQPLELKPPLERALKYVSAEDVLPVLVNVLSDTGLATSSSPTPVSQRPSQVATGSTTTARRTTANRGGSFTAGGGDNMPAEQLNQPVDNSAPLSVLVGKTRIIADRQANSILLMGPPESYDKVRTVLDRLDRKPPQVYLATIIGQLTLGDDSQLGVDYLMHFRKFHADPLDKTGVAGGLLSKGGFLGSVPNVATGALAATAPATTGGLMVFGSLTENLDVLVRALESTNRFKILSRPTVYAANNKKAVITSGQQVPVPTDVLTNFENNSNNVNTRTNIQYRDVVLQLEVIPLINSNKEVTLQIVQKNDSVIGEQTISTNEVPIIGTEQLKTTVTIPNCHTVVLGGLITDQLEKKDGGVPYLRRIPVLGHAFKSSSSSKVRKELIIFIQPVVVTSEDEQLGASEKEDARTAVGAEAAQMFPDSCNLPLPELHDSKQIKDPPKK
ncbi:MAG: secretin N-terminal domain-containing protein [Verrucomicrobiota bacterium]